MPQFPSFITKFIYSNCQGFRDQVAGGCHLEKTNKQPNPQTLLYRCPQLIPWERRGREKQFGSQPCHFSGSAAVCINWGAATDETTFCTFLILELSVGKAKHPRSSNLVWAWKVNLQKIRPHNERPNEGKRNLSGQSSYLLQEQKTVKDNLIFPQKIKSLASVQCKGLCLFSTVFFFICFP